MMVCFLFVGVTLNAQRIEPTYEIGYGVTEAKVGDTVELFIHIMPPSGWYVYSTKNKGCEISPILASITFSEDASYSLVGDLIPVGDKLTYDNQFECSIYKFEKKAVFKQKIVIKTSILTINGEFEGQMCSETTCVPLFPDKFVFSGLKVIK